MRELTVATVLHPEFLEDGAYQRVDHPGLNKLTQGDPILGWEGDPRLVVYVNLKWQNFVLFRLEHDNEYRGIAKLPSGVCLNEQTVNQLCRRLVEVDSRRGFDPLKDVLDAQAYDEKSRKNRMRDFLGDYADKLHWGLARSYLPGVDIVRPRQLPKRV